MKFKFKYKHWQVLGDNVTNQFYIVAVETFDISLKEDISNIFRRFINPKKELNSRPSYPYTTAISRGTPLESSKTSLYETCIIYGHRDTLVV